MSYQNSYSVLARFDVHASTRKEAESQVEHMFGDAGDDYEIVDCTIVEEETST